MIFQSTSSIQRKTRGSNPLPFFFHISIHFLCGRSKFLSKFLKILVKKIREIFPETGTYFFDKFTEKNRDLDSCSFERREDGAYITYTPPGGADPVVKKLGSNIQGKVISSNAGNTVNSTLNRSFTFTCSEAGFYLIIASIGGRTSSARGTISIKGVTPKVICNYTTNSATAIFSTSYAAYFEVKHETTITVSAYSDNGNWEADCGAATSVYMFQFT